MDLVKLKLLTEKASSLGCEVLYDANLRKYTSFKIGGKCTVLIEINSEKAATDLIPYAFKLGLRYFIFGNGSNLIVDDYGIDAVVFRINFSEISLVSCDEISCSAGAKLSSICKFALENSLAGMEFAYGIPATLGGAIYMNAGAYGGEMKDVISSVRAIDECGNLIEYSNSELDFSYRHSFFSGKKYIILSACIKLVRTENKAEILEKMNDFIERRRSKQPLEYASAGSTFKRPVGNYAALLIDEAGLKGVSVGDAEVSVKHSGFVINKGNASFDDLMKLIKIVKDTVFEKSGYLLEIEPEIISDRME